MKLLLCLYTCEQDQEHLAILERSELMQQVQADLRFQVLEVHADARLTHPSFHGRRLSVPCCEAYSNLSLKTWQMVKAVLPLDFDFLLKLDSTIAGYERKPQQKSSKIRARLTPTAVVEALRARDFFTLGYNGLVRQCASQEGVEAWLRTKGLDGDYCRVFSDGEPTPPYFLGKFYTLRRDFCQFIAAHGEAMAIEHHRYLGGSEDLMIGRLYQRWIDQTH